MKIFLLSLFFALPAYAHPGDLDDNLCHTCIEDCEAWGLVQDEFHCHDDQGGYINSLGEIFDVEGNKIGDSEKIEPDIPDIEEGIAPPPPDPAEGAMERDLEAEEGAPPPPSSVGIEDIGSLDSNDEGSSQPGEVSEGQDVVEGSDIADQSPVAVFNDIVAKAKTGKNTGWIFGAVGVLLVLGAVVYLIKVFRKKDQDLD